MCFMAGGTGVLGQRLVMKHINRWFTQTNRLRTEGRTTCRLPCPSWRQGFKEELV
ncbi:hypothetical protein AB0B89_20920 [Sphaerisporangium sp. NPDC049002]|uniref:hypothetical protein n=1 Tax=unclassified Sphaerisporangium TaxID=2630420 RepID=UPI0033C86E04